uniref:Cuticle protein n=1 Tax=Anopheles maculatus TaxID=74869 RepID=A0A182SCH8_9DIPT
NGGLSAKAESKSFDGVTRGSYSYLDAENKLQTVAYTADALNGFRVAASNLPVAPVETRTAPEPVKDTPEVAAAKADHMAAIEEAKLRNAAAEKESESEATIIAAAPATFAAAPAALPVATYAAQAPASFAYSTQSIAQPIAAYATYAAPAPAAIELKAPASFAYSTYTQSAPLAYTQYAAAPYATFPIAQYAYPAPAASFAFAARSQPVDIAAELPEPVKDTPEVAQAKEEHLKAVAEAKARSLQ